MISRKPILLKRTLAAEKLRESAVSVLPIVLIVSLLCLSVAPIPTDLMLSFLIGAVMLAAGMGIFAIGAESAMTPIGTRIGTALTKSRKLGLILSISFILGVAITVAEPDLQVLAYTVPHIDTTLLIAAVSLGVGFFLALCMLRIITGMKLRRLLMVFYGLAFLLAAFTDQDFLGVAFDSGGVTTGPMTVPFILALGVGVANIRSDKKAEADSFGLVALSSIGPILAVLVLGFFSKGSGQPANIAALSWENTAQLGMSYLTAIPVYLKEMAVALAPITVLFVLFQLVFFKMPLRGFLKICTGILFTYIGLVLFLTGVNVGFSSLGAVLGAKLTQSWTKYLLIPLSMLLGWFILSAEPAVYVLQKQIEEVSAGAIPGKLIKRSLCIAIALAMGLSMLRVVTGISLLWFLLPGYGLALLLSFFVPDIYTAIAFDSGGVASGPMTTTFMLQFMVGASIALGGNALSDAFGVVALVAMMPLITIQIMGVAYGRSKQQAAAEPVYGDSDIIELWG
ncbi:MAG: DUF1538 domain-containing protein [Eubacteriales bacterium]|nr:DUF1538 domain-containing protein [Eubacteriales bacterium]